MFKDKVIHIACLHDSTDWRVALIGADLHRKFL